MCKDSRLGTDYVEFRNQCILFVCCSVCIICKHGGNVKGSFDGHSLPRVAKENTKKTGFRQRTLGVI